MAETIAHDDSVLMKEKSLLKRTLNRHNNSSRAGYIPVHEQHQAKPAMRGHKTYAFWTLVMLLFFLALGNLILTFVILGVLRLGQGMESLELLSDQSLIKFYGNTDLDRVYKRDGKVESFADTPMKVTGEGSPVEIKLVDTGKNGKLNLVGAINGTTLSNVKSFEVKDTSSGQTVFSTGYPNFGLPKGVQKLDVQVAHTHQISSPVNASLTLASESFARLRGNEGTHVEGKEVLLSADGEINLKSVNGSVVFNAGDVSLDVKNMLVASGDTSKQSKSRNLNHKTALQYKVCLCMSSGKLFKVPSGRGCQQFDPKDNPCI